MHPFSNPWKERGGGGGGGGGGGERLHLEQMG